MTHTIKYILLHKSLIYSQKVIKRNPPICQRQEGDSKLYVKCLVCFQTFDWNDTISNN